MCPRLVSFYTSDTKQIQSTHSWTYVDLHVDEEGNCFTAENRALRDIKPKGLVVRYANPFTTPAKDQKPEVIHETSDAIGTYWRAPSGEHHVFSKTKHHFQEGEGAKRKWKKVDVFKDRSRFVQARGFGDRIIIGLGWSTGFVEHVRGEYRPIEIPGGRVESITGTGPDDIYVATEEALVHFDGSAWNEVPNGLRHAFVHSVSKDVVYATGSSRGDEAEDFYVYRGNARDGFTGLVPCPEGGGLQKPYLKNMAWALGRLYLTQSHDYERGVYLLDEGKSSFEQIVQFSGYAGRLAGNDKVLWVENGIELLCTNDGKTWKQVPRALHETSKG